MSSFTKQGKTPSVKVHCCVCTFYSIPNDGAQGAASAQFPFNELLFLGPVSYTHLTLPTSIVV